MIALYCRRFCNFVAREQFSLPASAPIFNQLEQLSQRSSVSRGVAFEDWLTAMVCALAAETKESEYLTMVDRHKAGKPGRRGVDLMGQMFATLVQAMSECDDDVLGDVFQGAITYGENGQYFTPSAVADLLARMTLTDNEIVENNRPRLVNDPCCGTGRMLLAAANVDPSIECVGQDIDSRCAKITAINLGLRGRYGWVLCGNSLTGTSSFAYRIGSFFHETPNGIRRGVIREVPPEATPIPILTARTRCTARDLLAESTAEPAVAIAENPRILEVPRWLARLETAQVVAKEEVSQPESPVETPPSPPESASPLESEVANVRQTVPAQLRLF